MLREKPLMIFLGKDKVGFIGAGSLATALISALINYEYYNIIASKRDFSQSDELNGLSIERTTNNLDVLKRSKYIVITLKGYSLDEVLWEIKNSGIDYSDKVFVTTAAGVRMKKITDVLGNIKLATVMPTIGSQVNQGTSVYFFNDNFTSEEKKAIKYIFSSSGQIIKARNEDEVIASTTGSCDLGYLAMYVQRVYNIMEDYIPSRIARRFIINNLRAAANWMERYSDSNSLENLSYRVGKPNNSFTNKGVVEFQKLGLYNAINSVYTMTGEAMKKF